MASMNAPELMRILNSLKNEEPVRDWHSVWKNEEEFLDVQMALDDLIEFSTMANPGTDLSDTENFIGRITIAKVQLMKLHELGIGQDAFVDLGIALEVDIKMLLARSPLVKNIDIFLKKSSQTVDEMLDELEGSPLENGLLFILAALSVMVVGDVCTENDEECQELA